MDRAGGRDHEALRNVAIEAPFFRHAEGSASIRLGDTWVVCAATVDSKVPNWLRGQGRGWITAEYDMLPRSVPERAVRGRTSGRTREIQRLIGRSLRAVADLARLGERLITLDCDVIEADGGTRTAAITAAYVALHEACRRLREERVIEGFPLRDQVAAVSVGLVGGELRLDLDHAEDQVADVDMNVVMTGAGRFVEIQGTAEGEPFSGSQLAAMTDLAGRGIRELHAAQATVLPWILPGPPEAGSRSVTS